MRYVPEQLRRQGARTWGFGDAIAAGQWINWSVQGVNFDDRVRAFSNTLSQTGSFNDIVIRTLDTQTGIERTFTWATGFLGFEFGYGNVYVTAKVVIAADANAVRDLIDWAFNQAGYGDNFQAWRSFNVSASPFNAPATITTLPANTTDLRAQETWDAQKQDLIRYGIIAAVVVGGFLVVNSTLSK